jgi:hydrogenase maturation protease
VTVPILVVGIGNDGRGDDAVGLVVARRVRARLAAADAVAVVECDGDAASLLDRWSAASLVIVIDAVRSGATAGSLHRVDLVRHRAPLPPRGRSSHALGLAEAVELGRSLGRLPPRLVLYGIEATVFDLGAPLSSPVAAAAIRVARRVVRAVRRPRA